MSLDDDRWLFDGAAWQERDLARELATVKDCGDPACDHRTCQDDDQAEDSEPDYSTVTMTEGYDL